MILLHTDGTHETVTIRGTATVCRVDGCDRPRNGRSTLCGSHRAQNHRTGKYALPRPSIEERFWAKVNKTDTCWLWTGVRDRRSSNAYGNRQKFDGETVESPHRFSYRLAKGEIPDGYHVDHLCRVPLCVNPDHLEAVTPVENLKRQAIARRSLPCAKGHDPSHREIETDGTSRCSVCAAQKRERKRVRAESSAARSEQKENA